MFAGITRLVSLPDDQREGEKVLSGVLIMKQCKKHIIMVVVSIFLTVNWTDMMQIHMHIVVLIPIVLHEMENAMDMIHELSLHKNRCSIPHKIQHQQFGRSYFICCIATRCCK